MWIGMGSDQKILIRVGSATFGLGLVLESQIFHFFPLSGQKNLFGQVFFTAGQKQGRVRAHF